MPTSRVVRTIVLSLLMLNACTSSAKTSVFTTIPAFSTPTDKIISTATRSPLYAKGPWLVYTSADSQAYVVNNDGTGLTSLFPDYSVWQVTGSSASALLAAVTHGKEELSYKLSLINLPSGNVYREIPLLSFFVKQPESFDNGPTGAFGGITGSGPSSSIQWSPDGQYIAFMGAIESPSSSLYIYDSKMNTVKKLSQNDQQAVDPIWSPDSQWIVYEQVSNFHGWITEGLWAVSVDGTKLNLLYKPENHIEQEILGWVGIDSIVVADKGMDGERNIRIVNVKTGNIKMLFPGYFFGVSLDTKDGAVAFSPIPGAPGAGLDLETGVYLVSPEITKPKLISLADRPIWVVWDSETEFFISEIDCKNDPGNVIAFTSSGDIRCVPKPKPNQSPDNQWYVILDDGVSLYKSTGEKSGTILEVKDGIIIWRPDSNGFFIRSNETLFYVSVPDLNLHNVYHSKNGYFIFSWAGIR